jgi:hypothetical protein
MTVNSVSCGPPWKTRWTLNRENVRPRRYSVRDLKAFQIALPLHRKAQAAFGADDSSADTMPPAVS